MKSNFASVGGNSGHSVMIDGNYYLRVSIDNRKNRGNGQTLIALKHQKIRTFLLDFVLFVVSGECSPLIFSVLVTNRLPFLRATCHSSETHHVRIVSLFAVGRI